MMKQERKSSQVFLKLACDYLRCHRPNVGTSRRKFWTSASGLYIYSLLYRVRWLLLVPMLLRGGKTCIDLCFVFKRLASWKKLAVKFEQAQISRKLPQVIASSRSNETQACTSKNVRWLAFSFDQGFNL